MIIKQTRILVGDAESFKAYLTTAKEGEDISAEILMGDPDNLLLNDAISSMYGKTYGTRHFIVSPGEKISKMPEMGIILDEIRREFQIPDSSFERIVVAMHEKERSKNGIGREFHYHIAVPEVDTEGNVLDAKFSYIRDEVIARKLEIRLGHEVIVGAHNPEVLKRLQTEEFEAPEINYDQDVYTSATLKWDQDGNPIFNVRYNTQRFEQALYDACIDVGMSEEQAEANYRSYRSFSRKKTPYVEAAKRLKIDLDKLSEQFQRALDDYRGQYGPKYLVQVIRDVMRENSLRFIYNAATDVMLVAVKTGEKLTRIGTLRRFLDITQKQVKPLIEEIVKGNDYDTINERPRRIIERSQNTGDFGQVEFDLGSDAGGRDWLRRWRESLSDADYSNRDIDLRRGEASASDVGSDQQADTSDQFAVESDREPDYSSGRPDEQVSAAASQQTISRHDLTLADFDLDGVKWLLIRSSAKLKQKTQDIPPEFAGKLLEKDGSLPEITILEPERFNSIGV